MKEYQKSIQEVLSEFDASRNGLTSFQVDDRQKQYGLNEMDQQEKESPLQIFLSQFKDLLVIVLIVAGFISMATGEIVSSIVIFIVITINAILGTVQTLKARKSLESLSKLSMPHVKVIRDGQLHQIVSNELTIGDLV